MGSIKGPGEGCRVFCWPDNPYMADNIRDLGDDHAKWAERDVGVADPQPSDQGSRMCRICLRKEWEEEEEKDEFGEVQKFVSPCGCTGSMQWVHKSCLRAWLAAAQSQGRAVTHCELCSQRYTDVVQTLRGSSYIGPSVQVCVSVALLFWLPKIVIPMLFLMCSFQQDQRELRLRCAALFCLAAIFAVVDLPDTNSRSSPASSGSELRPGIALCFLPADSILERSILPSNPFAESVVLLTDYSRHGAVGFIVNKGLGDVPPPLLLAHFSRGYGGPVQTRRGEGWAVLHAANVSGARRVEGSDFFVGGDRQELRAMALQRKAEGAPCHALAVRGYAGWGPGQLDGEVSRSAWAIRNVTPELIFDTPPELMWDAVCKRGETSETG